MNGSHKHGHKFEHRHGHRQKHGRDERVPLTLPEEEQGTVQDNRDRPRGERTGGGPPIA